MKNNRKGFIALLALALALIVTLTATVFGETTITATQPTADTSPALYVSQKNANSVVGIITSTQDWNRTSGEVELTEVAEGSGVVIREGGYILTNCHVIEDGTAFQVLMPDGEKVDAALVGSDSAQDLAVLQVSGDAANQLVPVTVASSSDLTVGATVIAIGNPGGEVLANTVTQGIVSALERTSVNTSNTTRSVSYIQHDAAINSGNSGGGLFDYKGDLIGINTLKYAGSTYSSVTYEGLGFAIPSDTAIKVANDLIDYGKVRRPALGITATTQEGPDEPLASTAPAGVCVYSLVEGGAAEKAGLKVYDFITKIDGQRVTTMLELTAILDSHEIGDTISVTVVRYNQASVQQQQTTNYGYGNGNYGYGNYGYGYGYGNYGSNWPFGNYGSDNSGSSDSSSSSSSSTGTLVVGGGYEEITVELTLEELQ